MAIQEITITGFRNLKSVAIKPCRHLNVLVGKNGSGKTSFLEAIHFLGAARSFRTHQSKQLINRQTEQFILFTRLNQGGAAYSVGVSRDKRSTKIKIANRFATSAAELAAILPIQVVNPDTHKLLEEGPRYRRRFIEWGVFHVKHGYMELWQKCRHILKQRNAALKANWPRKALAEWDMALVTVSKDITAIRKEYIQELLPYINKLIAEVGDMPSLEFGLFQGWPGDMDLGELLLSNWESDRRRGITQYGPHRADLKVSIDGQPARDVVSRGQQKMITALLKLGQVRYLEKAHPDKIPVLLIDDLPAELDTEYRQALMRMSTLGNSQVFITATDAGLLNVDVLNVEHRMFHVEHGNIEAAST